MLPGCPYFPAAYTTATRGAGFGLGLEYPDLLVEALSALPPKASWEARRTDAERAWGCPSLAA